MAKLDRRTRRQILASLCEGVSIRSCERIFDVEQNSVAKLLADAGDMAITLMKRTKGLMVETIQADELYSFVGAKQVNVDRMTVPVEGAGTVWGYLAVCAKSKLIFNYHLGDRSYPQARDRLHARPHPEDSAGRHEMLIDRSRGEPQPFGDGGGGQSRGRELQAFALPSGQGLDQKGR